jgi:hypothetical protein
MPPAKKKPTIGEIESLYHLPIAEAAQQLGICKTLLKQCCRNLNSKNICLTFSTKMAIQEVKTESKET